MYNSNKIYPILQPNAKGNFPCIFKKEIIIQNLSPIVFIERFVLVLSIFGSYYVSALNLIPTIYAIFYLALAGTIGYTIYREWDLKRKISLSDWVLFNFLSIMALFIPAFVGITVDLFATLPFVSQYNVEIWTITSIIFSVLSLISYSFLNTRFKQNIGKSVNPRTDILLRISLVVLIFLLLMQIDFQNHFSPVFAFFSNLITHNNISLV